MTEIEREGKAMETLEAVGKQRVDDMASWALQRCNLDASGNPRYADALTMIRVVLKEYGEEVKRACLREIEKDTPEEMSVYQRTCRHLAGLIDTNVKP